MISEVDRDWSRYVLPVVLSGEMSWEPEWSITAGPDEVTAVIAEERYGFATVAAIPDGQETRAVWIWDLQPSRRELFEYLPAVVDAVEAGLL